MNRKTALILASAAGLVVAAILIGHGRNPTAGGGAVAGGPADDPRPPAATCGKGGAPARASVDFGHGTASAALSAGRVLHRGDGEVYVSFDLSARDARTGARPPLNLAIVIDRSGSMDSERKLENAKAAALGIVSSLGASDRVALVQYDDTAQVVVGSTRMDDTGKARLQTAISTLYSGGSTNLHGGLLLGRDEVLRELGGGAVNRVILLSDGLANVGLQDTPSLARIASDAAEKGVRITAVGVGLDYNEDLMEALAESGRGNYYYVRDAGSLESVFAGEIRSMQATVAVRAELRLEPACTGVEVLEVFGYNSHKDGATTVVPLSDVFGGDRRKVVARLRVPAHLAGREDVLTARFAFDEIGGGGRKTRALVLGLEVTGDKAAVEASVDRDVARYVVEVEAARIMREATADYERGDVKGAQDKISVGRARAAAQAGSYGLAAEAVAPVYQQFDGTGAGIAANAPGSAGGKALIKDTKAKARVMAK